MGDRRRLPEGWKLETIESLAAPEKYSIKRGPFGGHLKKEIFVPSGYKVYEQKNAIENDFAAGTYYITPDKFNEMKPFAIKESDIIISCSGTIGKVAIVPPPAEPGIINQALLKITLNKKKMLPKYFKYLFESEPVRNKILGLTYGSAIKNVTSVGTIKKIEVPTPSLDVQENIITILNKAQETKNLREEADKLTEHYFNSVFFELFGDPFKNSKNWRIRPIGEVCSVTKLAGFEYTQYVKYKDEGEIIVIRALNVKDCKLKLDSVKFIDKKTSDFLVRSRLNRNDVVMTYIGVNIGDVAIVPESGKYHLAPNVAKLTVLNREELDPVFLLRFLDLEQNKLQFRRYTTDTAKQALNMSNIRKLKIPIPPIELQSRYRKIVEKVGQLQGIQRASHEEVHNLFDALMQKAFTGELVA